MDQPSSATMTMLRSSDRTCVDLPQLDLVAISCVKLMPPMVRTIFAGSFS